MATVDIPRGELDRDAPAWSTDQFGAVIVRCGNGHIAGIPDHTVDRATGRVSPSLGCADPDCDWHVYGVLIGYAELWE